MVKGYRLFFLVVFLLVPLPGVADSLEVTIMRQDCRLLQSYEPEVGQDPAYGPGVNVEGNPVAPADLEGTGFAFPESFDFPVEVTPFPDSAFSTSAIPLGQIRVGSDGQAYWNGEPLNRRARRLVAQECLKNSD